MFDDLKIRNKLILLMAGPIVIILLLSVLGAQSRRASAATSRRVAALVTVSKANGDVVDALEQEALYSAAYLGSDRDAWKGEVKDARATTDAALAKALPTLQGGLGGAPAPVRTSAGLAAGAADKLGYYRKSVDEGLRPSQLDELVVNYGDMQDTFLAVNTTIADSMPNSTASAELRGAAALGRYKASIARQGALMAGASGIGEFSTKAFGLFDDARTAQSAQLDFLNTVSSPHRKGAVRDAMASDAAEAFGFTTDNAAKAGAGTALDLDAKKVVGATSTVLSDLHKVEATSFDQLISSASSARSSAERAEKTFILAALIGIVGAIAAAIFLGGRITKPLRRLTDAADTLSHEQMPRLIEALKNPADEELGYQIHSMKPIDIRSHDEIGQLARSFNEVQRVAGEVANEQAQLLRKGIGEMFVNLARRNQALLDRQIEFIDELERGEEDPDQLDNLYRLDHLATRMRRNAESLLVLAGAEPPRRRGRPAPLANVVRAALAEVEDFNRIELLSFDEVLVASNAAADLAHLLSELMENATNFSPPETRVEVVGHKTKADGYVISITDHGIGMSGEQITEANEALARPPLVGLAMTRSLGFIVVGRLASRHGIAVRMMPSAAGGVTAVVSIPPSLVVDTPAAMAEAEPAFEPPARLKQVFEGAAAEDTGPAPLAFSATASDDSGGLGATSDLPAPVAWSSDPLPKPAADPAPAAAPDPAPAVASAASRTPAPLSAAPPEGTDSMPGPLAAPAPKEATPTPDAPAPAAQHTVPTRSIFDDPPADEDHAAIAAQVDEAVEPAMPAALSFDAPPAGAGAAGPTAPPSTVAAADVPAAAAASVGPARPFFLEDAQPPRRFGEGASEGGPAPAPTPAEAPAPAAPRLFGGPAPAAPEAKAAPAAPEARTAAPVAAPTPAPAPADPPLATRRPTNGTVTDGRPPAAPVTDGRPPAAPNGAPQAPAARTGAPAAPEPTPDAAATPSADTEPVTTSSGLAKRVPRSAGGNRAIPGSEVERGVSATRRSPEEIRNMLASHSAGRQRAQTQQPVPAGAPDERESHE